MYVRDKFFDNESLWIYLGQFKSDSTIFFLHLYVSTYIIVKFHFMDCNYHFIILDWFNFLYFSFT